MRRALLTFLPALLVYLVLVHRFNFLCDDAFITYHYARHLAEGHGLRFNIGADPVEGYSNFLWVLWNALLAYLRLDPVIWSRVTSVLCGTHLLWSVTRMAERRFGAVPAVLGGLFLATLAPFAAWSTGGLATVPFAWALFLSWKRFAGGERPSVLAAGLFALAACLLRMDGPVFLAVVYWATIACAAPGRGVPLFRAAALTAGIVVAGLLPYHAWRFWYFGDWIPQTARVKVTFSALATEQGAKYLAVLFLTFPSLLLALALPAAYRGAAGRAARAGALAAAGGYAYVLLVGGDWMALGRFVVPLLPFLAVSVAARVGAEAEGGGGPRKRVVAAAALIALSLPGAFDRAPVPARLLQRLHFRWNTDVAATEVRIWRGMRDRVDGRAMLANALRESTEPGASIVLGAVGVVPYYSGMFVYDRNGLVTRSVTERGEIVERRSPGHLRNVDPMFFLDEKPTVLRARVVPDSVGAMGIRMPLPEGYERAVIPLDPAQGFPPDHSLVIVRRKSR